IPSLVCGGLLARTERVIRLVSTSWWWKELSVVRNVWRQKGAIGGGATTTLLVHCIFRGSISTAPANPHRKPVRVLVFIFSSNVHLNPSVPPRLEFLLVVRPSSQRSQ